MSSRPCRRRSFVRREAFRTSTPTRRPRPCRPPYSDLPSSGDTRSRPDQSLGQDGTFAPSKPRGHTSRPLHRRRTTNLHRRRTTKSCCPSRTSSSRTSHRRPLRRTGRQTRTSANAGRQGVSYSPVAAGLSAVRRPMSRSRSTPSWPALTPRAPAWSRPAGTKFRHRRADVCGARAAPRARVATKLTPGAASSRRATWIRSTTQ